MKNKKEAVNRRNKKKFKKEKARRLRQKQARQERKVHGMETKEVPISTPSDWKRFLDDQDKDGTPYHQMTVFPIKDGLLGSQGKPGLLSTYFERKLELVLSLINTGQLVPDNIGITVLFSEEDSEKVPNGNIEVDYTSLMGFAIKEPYKQGLLSFRNLENWAEMLEQSVREALAMHEERSDKPIRSFGIFLVPVAGPFRESAIWKHMSDGANKMTKPYLVRH